MKRTILLILTLSLILGIFSSCGHKTVDPIDDQTSSSPSEDTSTANTTEETNDTNQSENTESDERLPDIDGTTEPNIIKYVTGYELKKVGDQWYMVFDSYNVNPADQTYWPPVIRFYSFGNLRSRILNHQLTTAEMNTIVSTFTRDEIGVPIFDLDEFYIPNIEGDTVVVDDFSFQYRCSWENGQEYTVSFYKDTDDNDGITTEKDIDLNFRFVKTTKVRYDSYIKQNSEKAVKTIQNSADNSVIFVIQGTSSAGINYYEAHIYISKGENYYFYLIDSFDEIPDDETLLSYGIEKYQE